jgi:hypothetical protein
MAKELKTVEVEDLEDILEDDDADETEETEESEGMRPKALAEELGVNAKSLRAFLRRAFPRTSEAKNTSWYLTEAQVEAARKNFTPSEDDEEETEEVEVEA